jgi:uncharacterized repeat protein (TIGR02543 family)
MSLGHDLTVQGDATYVALWLPKYFTVKYDPNGGELFGVSDVFTDVSSPYEFNDMVYVIAEEPVRAGFTFDGWMYDGLVYVYGDTFIICDEDVLFGARWLQLIWLLFMIQMVVSCLVVRTFMLILLHLTFLGL